VKGFSSPRILSGEGAIEKAAVNFTHAVGQSLPEAVSDSRKSLSGLPFEAVSLSVIVHPLNPFIPTTHMNLRLFVVHKDNPVWHFGGGYDLTPFYGFEEDAVLWHSGARNASAENYARMKKDCDSYFYLPHRGEHRGIGGLFFDDFNSASFESTLALVERIGNSFLPLYEEIFTSKNKLNFSEQNRQFQLFRRGRYVEFNLLHDRGTKYGLQSGRKVENVLASMPPLVSWVYNYPILEGSPEHRLTNFFLKPRNWLKES